MCAKLQEYGDSTETSTDLDSLLLGGTAAATSTSVSRLHFKHGSEEIVRVGGEELNLGVGVKAVQVGALRGQALIDVSVVALVV